MSSGVEVTGAEKLTKKFLGANGKIKSELIKGVLRAALKLEGVIRGTVMSLLNKSPTGNLARSFKARLLSDRGNEVSAGVFSDLPYARIQDEGGDIKPKSRANIAIPLTGEAKRRWPREWPSGELFFFISKAGNKILAQRGRGRDSLRPQYLLRPSVAIKGTHYLRTAATEATPDIKKIVGESVSIALKG